MGMRSFRLRECSKPLFHFHLWSAPHSTDRPGDASYALKVLGLLFGKTCPRRTLLGLPTWRGRPGIPRVEQERLERTRRDYFLQTRVRGAGCAGHRTSGALVVRHLWVPRL